MLKSKIQHKKRPLHKNHPVQSLVMGYRLLQLVDIGAVI